VSERAFCGGGAVVVVVVALLAADVDSPGNAPMVGKGGFIGMAMPCSSTKKPPTMSATWRLWLSFLGGLRERME
jgi:hypothetical protein